MENVKTKRILITSTSFQDTPGNHHDLLNCMNWKIDFMRGPLTYDRLVPVIGNYHGVICGDDEFNKDVLLAAKKGVTVGISKYGVGLDKIDLEFANQIKIKVINCSGVNSNTVAEHVFGLLLSFKKNIHKEYIKTKKGEWPRTLGSDIYGANFGVLGLGNIGKRVAFLAKSFGCNVFYVDKKFKENFQDFIFCESIEKLFNKVDIVSIHINLDRLNNGIISKKLLSNHTKPGIIIINTSRGKIVDENAIEWGLRKKIISGYLADVLIDEPPTILNKLILHENSLVTSHIASKTIKNVNKQANQAIKNLSLILE